MAPETVGRYHILRRLGAGGMGEVYLAEDTELKRRVAIKFLRASEPSDEADRARLVREARAAATLDHPNVCAIYEVGEETGRSFLAMQYVEGGTLADRLTEGAVPLEEATLIATQVADALADAHAHGIVHRDIKPQNIMLTARGQVKVLDFGLATQVRPEDSASTVAATGAGLVAGTIAYMSPEQLRAETVAASSDVFSYGCVVQEMVNGEHPFKRPSGAATISAILNDDPPALAPTVSPDLQRIVRKCLEKDASRRYTSAVDLLVDLRNDGDARQSPLPDTRSLARRWSRFHTIAAAASIVGLLILLTVWMTRVHEASPNAAARVVAILPLVTADESSAYLGDGISESVINSLTRLPNIKVLARATTFRYRGTVDPAALRRELGVDAVLSGTVSQQGGALVVQAELIDTADNTHIWGQRYTNRRIGDVFDVQEEIARAIASSLRLELGGREALFAKRYTDNVEAYRAYILGREYAQRRTVSDLEAAVNHYKEAIRRDGRYALAWAGLTDAYLNLAARGEMPYTESRRLALEAAERALGIDPDLAEAHAAVGQTHVYVGPFDFGAGDRALRRAIELNPGWPLAHQYQALSFLQQGRIDEGVREIEIAHEQDPLSGFITRFLAHAYVLRQDFPRAIATYRAAGSLGPQFTTIWEADVFVRAGATEEGLREIARAAKGREGESYIRFNRAVLDAASGRTSEALEVAREFDRQSQTAPVVARFAARLHMALGDHTRGLDLLRRSIEGAGMPIFFKDEPLWQPVRNDPRFLALLRRMRIPN